MNSVCSSYVTDDSLQELSEMSDFFLSSVTEHIKTEPADVIDEVGHVIMTSLAPVVGALSSSGIIYLHLVKSIKYKESKVLQVCLFFIVALPVMQNCISHVTALMYITRVVQVSHSFFSERYVYAPPQERQFP